MVSLKLPPVILRTRFENVMGMHFFLKDTEKKCSKTIKNCNYVVLFNKSAFRINVGQREVLELKWRVGADWLEISENAYLATKLRSY